MNDSLRTDLFMKFTPDQIGCACIWLAARQKKICLPKSPHWYELFNIKTEEMETIATTILELYILPRPDYTKLDNAINQAKDIFEKKKTATEKNNKIPELKKSMTSFSPAVKDSLISPPKKSPTDQITKRISKLAENGGKKKHHSPRRRYSPISPPRRKRSQDRNRLNRKKHASSNSSPSPSPPKHKDRRRSVSPARRHKRRMSESPSNSDSDSSSGSSTTSEVMRAEERKRRHNEKKKLQEKKELQEQIRVLEKGRNKKHKNTHSQRDYPKQSKHKVR